MMGTIKLHGNLAIRFTSELIVSVNSVVEALEALKANFIDFDLYLLDAARHSLFFRVIVNGQVLQDWQLRSPLPDDCLISIVPVARGEGGNAVRIIAGVALLGLGIGGVGFLGIQASTFAITGTALLLSAFHGRQKSPADSAREGKRSLIFGGPTTTTQAGGRVPIIYGVMLSGWVLISSKIVTTYQAA
jgi:predicted phage tail protein